MDSLTAESFELASSRLSAHVRLTPLQPARQISTQLGFQVLLKLENYQVSGSFKFRGALQKLSTLSADQRTRGFVSASTGNHARALCEALLITNQTEPKTKGVIFVPENCEASKLAALSVYDGIEVREHGTDCEVTETEAHRIADAEGLTWISPYNDLDIITGQGTVAVEILQQLSSPVDAVFVSVGGGGLISGVSAYIKKKLGKKITNHYWCPASCKCSYDAFCTQW